MAGKKLKSCNNDECRRWSDLPTELLYLILMQLTFIDIFAFGGVCKSWRLLASTHRQEFMEGQSPLIVALSRRAKRTGLLYNVFEGSIFKTVIPNFSRRTCCAISCGYLVIKDNRSTSGLWLFNPVTREEFLLSHPHFVVRRVIVASSTMDSSDITIVALSMCSDRSFDNDGGNLEIYRPRDEHPAVLHSIFEPYSILDLAIFKGKVFALSNLVRVGILNLRPHPMVTMLEVKRTCIPTNEVMFMRLVASDKQLFLFNFHSANNMFKLYELNFVRMEWLEVDNLGDQALFVSSIKLKDLRFSNPMSIEVVDAKRWGGRNNCLYYLDSETYRCDCFSLDGSLLQSFQIAGNKKTSNFAKALWYFPHLSCSTPSLSEDFFG